MLVAPIGRPSLQASCSLAILLVVSVGTRRRSLGHWGTGRLSDCPVQLRQELKISLVRLHVCLGVVCIIHAEKERRRNENDVRNSSEVVVQQKDSEIM